MHPEIPLLNILIVTGIISAAAGTIMRIIFLFVKKKHILFVEGNIAETKDTNSILIKKPDNFNYKSGQFCFISFYKKGMKKPHPFTISSSADEKHLMFTIKSQGKFTSKINTIEKGVKIKIDGPYGRLFYKRRKAIFIAGGVGITPFRSILGDSTNNIEENDAVLIYGNRTKDDIIFYNWLCNKEKESGIKVVNILSNEKKEGFKHGFVNDEIFAEACDFSEDFYICGPPIMVKNILKILKRKKVHGKRIYQEKFFW
jgi:predicted ferric reductase